MNDNGPSFHTTTPDDKTVAVMGVIRMLLAGFSVSSSCEILITCMVREITENAGPKEGQSIEDARGLSSRTLLMLSKVLAETSVAAASGKLDGAPDDAVKH